MHHLRLQMLSMGLATLYHEVFGFILLWPVFTSMLVNDIRSYPKLDNNRSWDLGYELDGGSSLAQK